MTHPYKRSQFSGAGNCDCGHAEASRVHPHTYKQSWKSELCVCTLSPANPIHTDAATAAAIPVSSGLAGAAAAVRQARGGDAPVRARGYA
jgi:hypothetical protein